MLSTTLLGAAALQLLRGKVLAVNQEGEILVENADDSSTLICELLVTGSAPPPVCESQSPVLYIRDEKTDRGYILGLIRKSSRNQKMLQIAANSRIQLKCGNSSLTMHSDGRIALKGVHVTSRASGINKIRGAAVKIN